MFSIRSRRVLFAVGGGFSAVIQQATMMIFLSGAALLLLSSLGNSYNNNNNNINNNLLLFVSASDGEGSVHGAISADRSYGKTLLADDSDGKMSRVLIDYNNFQFLKEATEFAADGQIRGMVMLKRNLSQILEFGGNKNNFLTIVINSTSLIDRIMESPYVDRVEIDQKMAAMVYSEKPVRYVDLKNDNKNQEETDFINKISTVRNTKEEIEEKQTDEENEEEERQLRKQQKQEVGNDERNLGLLNKDKGERVPYGITMVQAPDLWPMRPKNRFVEVCVVDTGYNAGHEDLPTVLAKQVGGTNTGAGVWFNDGHGHGTHCAGTIGAVGNNDVGVVGIREEPTLNVFHVGKGLADDGSGFSSNVMSAVQGCVDSGAKVISLSLGGTEKSKIEQNFYDDIYNQGALVIAAAGNSGDSGLLYPGGYPSVIAVSAVDGDGIRPAFSQCNDQVEIAAPGVDIMSTFPPNTYAVLSGTSMAGPHVAGIAAQLMSFFPECTNYQIRNAMVRSTQQVGEYPGLCNNGYGSGLVQGKAAYDMLERLGCEGAGGPIERNPANAARGGCEQNIDYITAGNATVRNVCPGKQLMSGGVATATSNTLVVVVAATMSVVVSTIFLS